jgi:hypothetical protein
MNSHKLFREIFDLPTAEEAWHIRELIETVQEAKGEFERVGVEFSYDAFKAYAHRMYEPIINDPSNAGPYADRHKRRLKIIDGDNLDIIEEAAKDKGLL